MKLYPVQEAVKWKHGIQVISFDLTTPAVLDNSLDISREDLIAVCEEYEAATSYINRRKEEYPSILDQLDQIYHEGVDAWKASIKAIKDKHPKPVIEVKEPEAPVEAEPEVINLDEE
jgi:hypothetical protein